MRSSFWLAVARTSTYHMAVTFGCDNIHRRALTIAWRTIDRGSHFKLQKVAGEMTEHVQRGTQERGLQEWFILLPIANHEGIRMQHELCCQAKLMIIINHHY